MNPNPPRPAYQIALLFLIALEVLAFELRNNALVIGVLIIIMIIAIYWFRYARTHSLKSKYSPKNAVPKEDWKGKTDKDNNPL
jgi:divalent metal cation (Fe/Co/Zn/Cd) transporter